MPPPQPQPIHQFLTLAFSPNSPHTLPYPSTLHSRIHHHFLTLHQSFPSLHPTTSSFTHNDGRTLFLLQSHGTIPFSYPNSSYSIPITIWLTESYPHTPPLIYLNPSPNMLIQPSHPHVDPSGLVSSFPWSYPGSTLLNLVHHLVKIFSFDPPLYTRVNSFSENWNKFTEDDNNNNNVYKESAITKLVLDLGMDIDILQKIEEREIEELFCLQSLLRNRESLLAKELGNLREESQRLERKLESVLMDCDVLEIWLKENEGEGKREKVGDVEEVFEICDELSKEVLECSAVDLAIEDLVYSLDRAVQEVAIGFDQYLKSVRTLLREQFFYRARGMKVKGVQMQALVAMVAARVSHF